MKILHISALPVWSMDGKGGMPSLRETLKGHAAAGHDIHLVLPQYDPFSDDFSFLFVPDSESFSISFARCRWLPLFKKIRSRAYGLFKKKSLPFVVRWMLNMLMYVGLTVSLKTQGLKVLRAGYAADLVYAHNQYAALAGFFLSRYKKIPNVNRLYGTFLADLMKKPLVSLRYPTAAAGYLVPSDLLICGNDGTRGDEVAKRFGVSDKRFCFWQNGIEPPSTPPAVTRDELVKSFPRIKKECYWMVSCSRLATWKRIDRMLHALTFCKAENINCQLIIAGDGPQKDNLEKLTAELDVQDMVVWLGAVAHDDIWALMNCADVFLITNDVTNRCNPLYEAAWAGLPVVSVHDQSTSDLLKHNQNSLLAEKDNSDELGQQLIHIFRNDELRKRLSNAQKELSKSFWTWEDRMKVEVKKLEELVDEKKSGKVA